MKKIIFIVMLMLGIAFTSNAQNANRSGIFFDVAPGYTFSLYGNGDRMSTTLDIGYRWAFNTHLALDAKVKASIPFDAESLGIGIMPGLRYTSAELGNSNKSIYVSVGLGCNFYSLGAFYDVEFGLNLSNHFYLGLRHDGYADYDYDYCGTIGVCLGYRF